MTVEGTIAVSPGARGGEMTVPPGFLYTSQPLTTARLAHPGIGLTSALFGKISVDSATTITQSDSDRSRGASTAYHLGSLLKHAAWGGGGGGGNSGSIGGSGGGRLTVLCQGAVSIAAGGIVTAYGEGGSGNGAGGGGGGVIVLASATSVTNSGNIIADGGDGADGDASRAPGGGGGGGLIAMIAPSVSAPGTE
jgi:hypothetical protein